MKQERYNFLSEQNYLDFEFDSDGPNGKIRKVVSFRPENTGGITYFSLGFGDMNDESNEVNDMVVSNNQDRNKVLATVAAAVLDFTERFPDMAVYATGSNRTRTRLYQMLISRNLPEIEAIFEVMGSKNDLWEQFRKNVNYDAFLIQRIRKIQ